jgi:hypothetical protein
MFNLEQSIAEWRRQMLAAGIKTPVPLEELESHLREEIEWQMESGLAEQKAFEISVPQIGQPQALSHECALARLCRFPDCFNCEMNWPWLMADSACGCSAGY